MCVARVVQAIRASLGTGTLLKTFLLETAEQIYPLEMHQIFKCTDHTSHPSRYAERDHEQLVELRVQRDQLEQKLLVKRCEEMKIDKDKMVEMDDEEMDDIEDSDLDAFLPKDKTLDQQNKNQASDSESDYEEILDGDDDEEEEEEEVEKIEIKTEVARTREVEVKTKVDNKALVPSKPVEPLNKGTASVETILSQYEELNTVKVAKAEVKKEVEMEDANIKSILARYGPDSLVVGKAKDDPEPILKVVEEDNGNPGEEFIEEELQKPSIEEEIEKPKTGNFDFTSLTGLSDDEDEVEADEKIEESTGKEVPIPNLELVKMKQEETLAEIAEQVRCGKQKFRQF